MVPLMNFCRRNWELEREPAPVSSSPMTTGNFFLLGKLDVFGRHPAKIVDEVAALRCVPPTERLHFQAEGDQGSLSLFDLGLHAAVCEREGQRAVEQDFHG